MGAKSRSVMIIDSHPIVHDGIRRVFEPMVEVTITTSAYSASEALAYLLAERPDLVIAGLWTNGATGCYLLQKIRHRFPRVKILAYGPVDERLFGGRVATAGAQGYVMKSAPTTELVSAVKKILDGRYHFDASVLRRISRHQSGRPAGRPGPLDHLSNRELDIFCMIGHGYDSHRIARMLSISRNTVDTHRINIKKKLDLPSGKALDRSAYEFVLQGCCVAPSAESDAGFLMGGDPASAELIG